LQMMRRLASGGTSLSEFNARKRRMTPAQEAVLVNFLEESAAVGLPRKHKEIVRTANDILREAEGFAPDDKSFKGVTESWITDFLSRHHDKLKTHWAKPLDMQRAQSLNPPAVHDWYHNIVHPNIHPAEDPIPPERVWGMDEGAICEGDSNKEFVVGGRDTKTQHKQGGASKKNVTAIVCICADGSTTKPTLIYSGKNMMHQYGKDNVAGATCGAACLCRSAYQSNCTSGLLFRRTAGQTASMRQNGLKTSTKRPPTKHPTAKRAAFCSTGTPLTTVSRSCNTRRSTTSCSSATRRTAHTLFKAWT
jgi:hypothetical protein